MSRRRATRRRAASAASKRGTAESPWLIGMSQCNLGEPWRVQMNEDVKQAAEKHPNLKVVFKDAQNDSLRQRAQVEELVAQKIDLLIISPKEAAPLTQPVAEAYNQKIPVIVLDRAVQGDAYTTFIGADNVKIGREAGKWAVKALGGKGLIVELKGLMTSTPGQDRNKGFREGLELEKNPGLKLVFEADMQWLEPNARKEMESALTTQKKIDLVYAHNDPGAHGAYLAAKAADREKGDEADRYRRPAPRGRRVRQAGSARRDVPVSDRRHRSHRLGAAVTRRQERAQEARAGNPCVHQGQREEPEARPFRDETPRSAAVGRVRNRRPAAGLTSTRS